MANYTYYRVGRHVVHIDYPKQVGKIIAGSHVRDRYLVRWTDGSTSRHIRGALRPAPAAGN